MDGVLEHLGRKWTPRTQLRCVEPEPGEPGVSDVDFVEAVMRVLAPFEEARAAVMAALEELVGRGEGDWVPSWSG